jgi:hypothetical protein
MGQKLTNRPGPKSTVGVLSDAGVHPCFPGQRPLSSCQARAGMVGPAGTTHQAALHPNLLPAVCTENLIRID